MLKLHGPTDLSNFSVVDLLSKFKHAPIYFLFGKVRVPDVCPSVVFTQGVCVCV